MNKTLEYNHAVGICLIILLSIICYSNAINNGFIWDDESFVTENAHIRSLNNIASFFYNPRTIAKEKDFSEHVYRPLVTLSFALDYKFWKLNPNFYHLENILFHLANALLCYMFIFLLFDNPIISLLSAVIFLIHPVQTEAVTWISGRANVLFLFFYLLTLMYFLLYRKSKKRVYYYISLCTFLFSVFSKEMALTLPFVLFLILWIKQGKRSKNFFLSIPYFLISILYLSIRFLLLNRLEQVKPWARGYEMFLTMTNVTFSYIKVLFYPYTLCADRLTIILHSLKSPNFFIPFSIIISILFFAVFSYQKHKTITFSIFFFFLTLLPVLNIIPINVAMAERFLYLPSIGFGLFSACLIYKLFNNTKNASVRRLLYFFTIAVFILLSIKTISRNNEWKDAITFYNKNLEVNPLSARFRYNLATYLIEKNRLKEAGEELQRVIVLKNDHKRAYNTLGNVFALEGDHESAIRCFKQSIVIAPDSIAYNSMGISFYEMGDYKSAIENYKKAIALNGNYANAYINLGNAYYQKKDTENAKKSWQKALEIDPSNDVIRSNLKLL